MPPRIVMPSKALGPRAGLFPLSEFGAVADGFGALSGVFGAGVLALVEGVSLSLASPFVPGSVPGNDRLGLGEIAKRPRISPAGITTGWSARAGVGLSASRSWFEFGFLSVEFAGLGGAGGAGAAIALFRETSTRESADGNAATGTVESTILNLDSTIGATGARSADVNETSRRARGIEDAATGTLDSTDLNSRFNEGRDRARQLGHLHDVRQRQRLQDCRVYQRRLQQSLNVIRCIGRIREDRLWTRIAQTFLRSHRGLRGFARCRRCCCGRHFIVAEHGKIQDIELLEPEDDRVIGKTLDFHNPDNHGDKHESGTDGSVQGDGPEKCAKGPVMGIEVDGAEQWGLLSTGTRARAQIESFSQLRNVYFMYALYHDLRPPSSGGL